MWLINLIPAPYRLAVAIAIAIAMLAGATYGGWKWRDYQAKADQLHQVMVANQALADEVKRVTDLTNRLRVAESEGATRRVKDRDEYERNLLNVAKTKDRVIADLHADIIRLRDPWTRPASGTAKTDGASTSATPGVVLPVGGSELSKQLSEYLIDESGRADGTVVELNYCRSVAREQHDTCNKLLLEMVAR